MTFISYAQNSEDVMLWRALNHIEKGFYVDVGANDPIIDSVTKAFYERGWRGINIEPVRHWHDKLMLDRPEDLNLNIAISDQPGVLRFYDVQDTGLSTSDKDIAEQHSREHGFLYKEIMVPALTLDSILKEYNSEIHFLKVDVEGAEKKVLASIDLTKKKPWIILVEATKPLSQSLNFGTWEGILIDSGYTFVYFDGINRFYVSPDKNDLLAAFDSPPNFFDGVMAGHYKNSIADRDNIRTQLDQTWSDREDIIAELQGVYRSRSYRITAPMRAVFGFGRVQRARLRKLRSKLAIKARTRTLLRKTVKFFRGSPFVVLAAETIKRQFPTAWSSMSTKVKGIILAPQQSTPDNIGNPEDETHFLNLFQREINKRKNS